MNPLIKKVQEALLERGYDPGKIDGIDGPKTKKAIMAFQTNSGLTPTVWWDL